MNTLDDSKRSSIQHRLFVLILVPLLITACAKYPEHAVNPAPGADLPSITPPDNSDQQTPISNPPTETAPIVFEALAWEASSKPYRKDWSEFVHKEVQSHWLKFQKAQDPTIFCPKYFQLTDTQKVNTLAQLIVGMSYYESGWSPVSRMKETTMGTDPVTKQPVYSEGLLQLSYQDIQWAPYCKFDWAKDKNLSGSDPKKTILDPYLNLSCGIRILADQINKTGKIVLSSGVYWSVIKNNGKYEKIDEIATIVKKLSFCK